MSLFRGSSLGTHCSGGSSPMALDLESSRHFPSAVAPANTGIGGRHTKCACYFVIKTTGIGLLPPAKTGEAGAFSARRSKPGALKRVLMPNQLRTNQKDSTYFSRNACSFGISKSSILFVQHSQTTSTCQPSARSFRRLRRSRIVFAERFIFQNSEFVAGVTRP